MTPSRRSLLRGFLAMPLAARFARPHYLTTSSIAAAPGLVAFMSRPELVALQAKVRERYIAAAAAELEYVLRWQAKWMAVHSSSPE